MDGSDSAFGGQLTSTFFDESWIPKCSPLQGRYLLRLQNAFLRDAYAALSPGGSVIINLGGRVPVSLVKEMFVAAGYQYQELFAMLKVQLQPEWVLGGYARAEKKYHVVFDLYRFDAARKKFEVLLRDKNISTLELKKILKPFHVSATEGLKRLVYGHERIGHIVQVIRGVKKPAISHGRF